MHLELSYTQPQLDIIQEIENQTAKYFIITKGRRFGLTHGIMNAYIEWALEGQHLLWGDTISTNIDRYWERYALPVLNKYKVDFKYDARQKKALIGSGFIDFRSADRPENWEGFGYHKIFLNEAGIILKNDYLYTNAVLPMLIDYPNSVLIAGGVPKGKVKKNNEEHKFYTLYKNWKAGYKNYYGFEFNSYDNPLLNKEDIQELEEEIRRMSPKMKEQEIDGKFVDGADGTLWTPELIKHSQILPQFKRVVTAIDPSGSTTGDQVGIVTSGLGIDNKYYVISDKSGNYSPSQWGEISSNETKIHRSDCLVIERNYGGDMAKSIFRQFNKSIRIKEVHAYKGKELRAEPVVSQYEQDKVYHNIGLQKLENELLTWVPGLGKSPNRLDAMVYTILELNEPISSFKGHKVMRK